MISSYASVHVEAFDRPALERLIRYCGARPSFVSENLRWNRDILVYRLPKVYKDGLSSIQLKPLEFLDRISTLIPSPRVHLHHYHGVLAANAPFRKEITAHANKLMEEHIPEAPLLATAPKPKRSYSWQKLLARIYEVFPLTCTCGEAMKIIAFITNPHTARHILSHLKLCTNPFDPLPFEREPEYTICDLLSYTEDGFPDSYDTPRSQPVPEVIRWKGSSAHKNKEAFANEYEPIPEYEICDLLPGTPDGFPDPYDDWLDSS
jgi:hypothetical protein